jgi:hypothetical protein
MEYPIVFGGRISTLPLFFWQGRRVAPSAPPWVVSVKPFRPLDAGVDIAARCPYQGGSVEMRPHEPAAYNIETARTLPLPRIDECRFICARVYNIKLVAMKNFADDGLLA